MLVLSRKAGESIQIGSDITLTVLEIQGNRMKVGISAPGSQRVLRGELVETAKPGGRTSGALPTNPAMTAWLELPVRTGVLAVAR